jgi:hypothetical protein
VTKQQLIGMDQLERTDQANGYRREMITVKTADQQMLKTFCYLKQPDQLQKAEIRLGPLSVYSHQHAAMYQSRL